MKFKSALIIGMSALTLSACGGGGSSSSGGSVTPPGGGGSTGPTWTRGTFESSSNFAEKCAVPRAGTTDQSGSILYENHFLRSWSNETYLWYNEITDLNPANYTDKIQYFNTLKTTATTASGNAKDKFHFTYDTAVYEQLTSSGESAGYGTEFALLQSRPPRDVRVAYTVDGTPAGTANLQRGAKILTIDGVDVINGSDTATLNDGLFPSGAGESHTFVVQDVGSDSTRTVTMTSAVIAMPPVLLSKTIDAADSSKVGYMVFNTFGTVIAEDALVSAVTDFKAAGVKDLILDLRYNGGGYLAISSQLGYMVAGSAQTKGKTFENLVFNDKNPTTNPVTGATLAPTPFYTTTLNWDNSHPGGAELPTLNLPRVYVLSTDGTCSASEAIINALRGIDVEVVLIGTTTCGKPYGFYPTDNCGTTYFTIQFKGENNKGFGDYADGFSPSEGGSVVGEAVAGCIVSDDYNNGLGSSSEALLSAAMTHINTGACPSTSTTSKSEAQTAWNKQQDQNDPLSLLSDPRLKARILLKQSSLAIEGDRR